MLLSELLRHFPDLHLLAGHPERMHVHRLDVLAVTTPPVDGTLYLHASVSEAQLVLQNWLRRYRLEQICVLIPAGPDLLTVPEGPVTWLGFATETLPIDLSARLLRVLMEQPRGLSEQEGLRDEFVEELLTRPAPQATDVLDRALGFGLDLTAMTRVLVVGSRQDRSRLAEAGTATVPSRQELFSVICRAAQVHPRAQVFRMGAQVVVLSGLSSEDLARHLAGELQREFPAHYVLAALGEPVGGANDLARSYRTARAALELALDRPQPSRWVSYDSLRHLLLYRELRRSPELSELIEGSLRPLLDLPGEYRRVLLETLAAYLEHNRSPNRAAAALGVHPNTLKYRMRRISEVLDLETLSGSQFVLYYLAAQLNL